MTSVAFKGRRIISEKVGKGVANKNMQLVCNAPGIRKSLLRQEKGRELNQTMVGLNIVTYFEIILMKTNYSFFRMLEYLTNCKIPSSAIHPSFIVKYLLLLPRAHSQLLMAKPKLLGTDNTILRGKKTQDLRNVGYVEDESQTCPKSRMTEQRP